MTSVRTSIETVWAMWLMMLPRLPPVTVSSSASVSSREVSLVSLTIVSIQSARAIRRSAVTLAQHSRRDRDVGHDTQPNATFRDGRHSAIANKPTREDAIAAFAKSWRRV